MIFFPVVNEACRILAEGIAVKAADLDIAAVMGMGFPPYRCVILSAYKSRFILFVWDVKMCHAGEVLSSGPIHWVPSTFVQDWINGQRCMEISLSLALTWPKEQPRGFLWWEILNYKPLIMFAKFRPILVQFEVGRNPSTYGTPLHGPRIVDAWLVIHREH